MGLQRALFIRRGRGVTEGSGREDVKGVGGWGGHGVAV